MVREDQKDLSLLLERKTAEVFQEVQINNLIEKQNEKCEKPVVEHIQLVSPVPELADQKVQENLAPLSILPKLDQKKLEDADLEGEGQSSVDKCTNNSDTADQDLTPVNLPVQEKAEMSSPPHSVRQVKFAETFIIDGTVGHATLIQIPQTFVNTVKREEPVKGIAARIAIFSAKNLEQQPINNKPSPKLKKEANEVFQEVKPANNPVAEESKDVDLKHEEELIEEFNAQPVINEGLPTVGLPATAEGESKEKKALKLMMEKLLLQADIPIEQSRLEKPKREVDETIFAPISCLIKEELPETGLICVKKNRKQKSKGSVISLKTSKKRFSIDPQIIVILKNSPPLFDRLTLTEIETLRGNLGEILSYMKKKAELEKKPDPDLVTITGLIDKLNTRELILWVEKDYHEGLLEENCRQLARNIITKIKQGEGHSGIKERLFRQTALNDTHSKITAWKRHDVEAENKFTAYDWYAILSRYIENFPAEKLKLFAPFKEVNSVKTTLEEMSKLPMQDQAVVGTLLILQRITLDYIWAPEDQKNTGKVGMLSSATSMLTANIINKLLSPSSKVPEGITGVEAKMYANMPNFEFLAELIADYMPKQA